MASNQIALHVPIYKATYDLLLKATECVANMPKDFKSTIGQNLHETIVATIMLIYEAIALDTKDAEQRAQKMRVIDGIITNQRRINLILQLMMDMRHISPARHAEMIELLASIGKQAGGWKKAA